VTSALAEYLGSDWPGCARVFRLTRVRKAGGKVETEVVFGIASLPRERAGAKEWLRVTRGHWGIENGLHAVRDGTLREDASRIRKGSATQAMAIVRNLVIFLFNRRGDKNDAAATRHYDCHPQESLKVLSTPV
jgi:Transposase DDE domain